MMGEYDAGYENYIDSLIREIEKLQDENDKLSEQVSSLVGRSFRTADKMSCIEAENAKLRELLSVMAYCNQFRRDCDGCSMNGAAGIITGRAGCDELLARMRELGVEVTS
jgi:hypothetical protein